jgi:adenosine deaminase
MHSIYKQYMLRDLCTQIPKAELHVHLEGTFELDLMEKLAYKHKIDVP